ncbi:MAG: excinuclease ABC subunit UvrC [Planctomycetota bacterium]
MSEGGPRWSIDGVPELPGVYLFHDAAGKVLYVGKARNLRSRLFSYRRPGGDGRLGVLFLEQEAERVETIVTRTEQEALLLEAELIKRHQPPHNVRLRDDKSFLMVRLDLDERFPRLKFVRAHDPKRTRAGGRSRLFGPFASSGAVRRTLSDLHRIVPLRDCSDAVLNNRSRPCLKHQIGLCSAPCVGLVDEQQYAQLVSRAVDVLSGDTRELEDDLRARMQSASERLEYEQAAFWRDRLEALRRTSERQGVRPSDSVDRDVLGLAREGDRAVVHRLAFRGGQLVESRSHTFRTALPDEDALSDVVTALYGTGGRRKAPREVVVPCRPADEDWLAELFGVERFVVPASGERLRFLDVAGENARAHLVRAGTTEEQHAEALRRVAELAGLDPESPPETIDCFDVSNTQGAEVVASRVRFVRGVPDRSGYRRFTVRGVAGQDDFASMAEVVGRSLRRGLREDDLPDLVVVDGGAQQLASALAARDEAGAFDVPMVGLAKARSERGPEGRRKAATEERLFLTPESEPLDLPKHDAGRHLLERLRDEAHRFAITFHRQRRGKIKSRLDAIPGVGETRRKALLRTFGSATGVSRASVEEIAAVQGIGLDLAKVIAEHLRSK